MVSVLWLVVVLITDTCMGDEYVNDGYAFPRIIWMHWERNIPEDVKEMIETTLKSLSNFTIHFLTDENISQYLNVSTFPNDYKKLLEARQRSCYIRVCLLEKFGGFYVDSTVIVNSGNEVEYVFSETLKRKSQLVALKGRDHVWPFTVAFFGASVGSSFLRVLKNEYDTALGEGGIEEYMRFTRERLMNGGWAVPIEKYSNATFAIDFLCKKVMFENPTFNESTLLLPMQQAGNVIYAYRRYIYHEIKDIPIVKIFAVWRTGKRLERKNDNGEL